MKHAPRIIPLRYHCEHCGRQAIIGTHTKNTVKCPGYGRVMTRIPLSSKEKAALINKPL